MVTNRKHTLIELLPKSPEVLGKSDWKTSLDWKQIAAVVSTIITALVSSGILATTSTQSPNTPDIEIDILPRFLTNTTLISLSNIGNAPATNLTLLIITPADITAHREFHTENLTLTRNESRLLEYSMPRFVQGDESVVVINVTMKTRTFSFDDIYVYAVYDQGSSKGEFKSSSPTSQLLYDFRNWWLNPRNLATVLIIIAISSLVVFLYLRMTRTKRLLGRINKRVSRVISGYIAGKMDKKEGVYLLERLKKGIRRDSLGRHRINEKEWIGIEKIIDDGIKK